MRTAVVIAVVLAVAAAFVWWPREKTPAPVPVPEEPTAVERAAPAPAAVREPPVEASDDEAEAPLTVTEADDELPTVTKGEVQAFFSERGIDYGEAYREWRERQGYVRTDAVGNYLLDQPYQQYDDETLRALGDGGDRWALQILADRLRGSRPAEAVELYRRAAALGSVYAAQQIAAIYRRVAHSDTLDGAEASALRSVSAGPGTSAAAWGTVSRLLGADPDDLSVPEIDGRRGAQERAEICELAISIYRDLVAERAAMGAGTFDRTPPPLVYARDGSPGNCMPPPQVQYDVSGCEEILMVPQRADGVVSRAQPERQPPGRTMLLCPPEGD